MCRIEARLRTLSGHRWRFCGAVVRASIWVAAALIALAGCGQQDQPGAGPTAGAQPDARGAELRAAAAADPRLAHFYEARGWRTAWTPRTEAELVAAIGGAEQHGLDKAAFLGPVQQARSAGGHDAALSRAALAYAEALARGRTDPARIRAPYTVPRPGTDFAAGLAGALEPGRIGPWLAGLAPQDGEYRALSQAYVEANRQIVQAGGHPPANLLERARTLAVNLERRRWLERTPPATRIDVNTGAAMLTYWRDGRAADSRRVVAGEPGRETPELGSPLFRLVANPTWTVPRSIESEVSSPASMRRHHMERRDGWIVQQSGPFNSLGLVKFDLRNDQEIYLHDTPAKSLFARPERHASHGCVRVSDALGFAAMIAEDEGVLDEWNRALAAGDEGNVALPHQIPVRLFYQTAYVDNGRVVIVPDVYGWDEDVAVALGLPRRARPPARAPDGDLGP
jgi:murein L,D-transpeptidase YcbB/YkuD